IRPTSFMPISRPVKYFTFASRTHAVKCNHSRVVPERSAKRTHATPSLQTKNRGGGLPGLICMCCDCYAVRRRIRSAAPIPTPTSSNGQVGNPDPVKQPESPEGPDEA